MMYKIGDVAKILGISPDLLRYYEKKGVVMPMKGKHNDYRYYDFWDINFLLDCLWFKNFGFSIDQIADMVKIPSSNQLGDLFLKKRMSFRPPSPGVSCCCSGLRNTGRISSSPRICWASARLPRARNISGISTAIPTPIGTLRLCKSSATTGWGSCPLPAAALRLKKRICFPRVARIMHGA